MRYPALVLMIVGLALPAWAAKQVTVAQLEKALDGATVSRDAEVVKRLTQLELTERLSDARFVRLQTQMPGALSQQALVAVADASTFLKLPAEDLPATPAPDRAAQDAMLAKVFDYARRTIPRLPNFFATRETTRFEETPARPHQDARDWNIAIPLHFNGKSIETVLYRNGNEIVEAEAQNQKAFDARGSGLDTSGAFGAILPTVLADALQGTLTWGYWEQEPEGTLAVFRFSVPEKASHYTVASPTLGFEIRSAPAYHGEIEVNPADGAILRLMILADIKPAGPVAEAGIMVRYGPVDIGGQTYICPLKSVARSVVRAVPGGPAAKGDAPNVMLEPTSNSMVMLDAPKKDEDALEATQVRVNDVLFKKYHLFRAETRIVTGEEPSSELPAIPAAVPQH